MDCMAGAHTLGRAKPNRSGFGKESTKYTKDGPGNPGGSSWTPEWLKFDNSYFKVCPLLLAFCHGISAFRRFPTTGHHQSEGAEIDRVM